MTRDTRPAGLRIRAALLALVLVLTPVSPSAAATATGTGQRIVNLQYQGRTYRIHGDERDERLLRSIYGPDWQTCLAYRAAVRLQEGQPAAGLLAPMQATHGNSNIVYTVQHSDDRNLVHPGEKLWANVNGNWQRVTVRPGDSLDSMARRYGTTVDELAGANGDRFDLQSPQAQEGPTGAVTIPDSWNGQLDDRGLDAVLAHEGAHTTDRVGGLAGQSDYGTVDGHELNEITTPRAAWMEGYAEYAESLLDPGQAAALRGAAANLDRDPPSGNPADPRVPVPNPTYADMLASEATVANTLADMDGGDRANRARILDTVGAVNGATPPRDDSAPPSADPTVGFGQFMQRYVERNPDDAGRVLPLFDAHTRFTATDEQLRALAGSAGNAYLGDRDRLRGLWNQFRADNPSGTPTDFLAGLANPTAASLDGMNLLGEDSSRPAGGPEGTTPDSGTPEGSSPEGSSPDGGTPGRTADAAPAGETDPAGEAAPAATTPPATAPVADARPASGTAPASESNDTASAGLDA